MTARTAILGGIVTPFADDGRLDEGLLRMHLQFIAAGGAGVYLCGHGSGEGDLLTRDEKVRVYEIGVDELKGTVPVTAFIANTGSTAEVVDLARRAEQTGVDAIEVVAPRPGPRRPLDDELETYFRDVIDAVSCAVHVNDNQSLTGYTLPDSLLERLVADHPRVTGVNLSIGLQEITSRITTLRARFGDRVELRAGIMPAIQSVRALGGDGLLCFEPNVAPRLTVDVWNGPGRESGGWFEERFRTLMRLNAVLSHFGNPRSLKAALRVLGRDAGIPRKPYLPLPAAATKVLAAELAELQLERFDRY
jgi:4-hydroxy-tetrahydrodipicolinate synthase